MSFGYQPPKQDKSGSWTEVFEITRVAFGLLLPMFGALLALLTFFVVMVILFAQHPALALIPLIAVGLVIAYFLRRERRAHDEEVARVRGD